MHAAIALLGLAMAWIALRLYRRMPDAKPSRACAVCAVVFALASIAGVFSLTLLASHLSRRLYDRTRQPALRAIRPASNGPPSSRRSTRPARPFLIYMKKRDADRPFFVMWVDNAELLLRK